MNPRKNADGQHARISVRGAWVGAVSIALVGAGMARLDGLLSAMGLAGLLVLGGAFWLSRWHLSGWVFHCQAAHTIHVRQCFSVLWSACNQKRFLGGFSMQVEISMIGNMKDTWHLANVNAGDLEQRHAMLIPLLRGRASTHHVRWSSSFPLGLWLREKFTEFAHDLTIFPHPQRTKTLSFAGRARDAASPHGDPFSRGGGEWRGLRAWRAGDSPQRIHVAASSRSHARGTGLMVSECDPPGHLPQRVVVAFHSHAHDGALIRPEVFEQALSQLCGILTFLTSQGIPALFLADFDHWLERHCDNRAQLTEIFHLLAKTRRHAGTERHDLARIRAQYESEDCWVVVSDMAAESWRHLFVAKSVIIHCLSPLTRRPS